jgi:hypothetical protein
MISGAPPGPERRKIVPECASEASPIDTDLASRIAGCRQHRTIERAFRSPGTSQQRSRPVDAFDALQ